MVCGPNFFIYFLYSHKLIKGGINPLFALRLYAHLLGPGKKQVDKQINTGLLNIPVSIYMQILSVILDLIAFSIVCPLRLLLIR